MTTANRFITLTNKQCNLRIYTIILFLPFNNLHVGVTISWENKQKNRKGQLYQIVLFYFCSIYHFLGNLLEQCLMYKNNISS